MSYIDLLQKHVRLIILRALAGEANYSHNDSILNDIARSYGVDRGRDFVRSQIRWLENIGAVSVQEMGAALIVTATQYGVDHAQRRVVIDGVQRPGAD
jgi:hypothetical protein